jgi:protein-tyrosine-phosphatase
MNVRFLCTGNSRRSILGGATRNDRPRLKAELDRMGAISP